ncbi:BCCT family transporter [Romboutsia sp. 1001216sp1]|uniref:glycine betaine uptake BCCT transporter n=1 Tax=Romboutsia TaxID=1501226 RepID=UPI000ACF8A16|nr:MULTISPECIES: BCCT family transporter [Romboutsia]MDB8793460.1 BCCT family transporter [Romboutsia sp. 1001216sp1]MDB8797002.1 BCCT family transporter [Romboutsia sp. 1001216sp1]MDB8799748.1 BCCT family transporter [Romboutsia sp. 1001216sp1]MDB8805666.1 BCCT family transporter [Romboutsia sp. 1001216sp1]MDB8807518.1 BCCT family transporter [Romboutsia sp. 1001216sp1]
MVFYISVAIIGLFVLWGLISPNSLASTATLALAFTTDKFGWMFLIITFLVLVFMIALAFSKYGRLRLGHEDDRPEFSNITWFGMLFSAGMGIGLVFWGVAEPLDHYIYPLSGIPKLTPEAANAAITFSFFHWGLHAWAIYSLVGLTIAYFRFRKDKKLLISQTLSPIIGGDLNSPQSKFIDILAIIATAFGVATSLGLGAMQINGGLNNLFGININIFNQIIIIIISTILFLISSTTGLEKGIKILSNINVGIAVLLLIFVFILGPTANILEVFTNNLGNYLQNIISMSLRLTPFEESNWIANWTLFYWAWWIAWSPFVGVFIARVSKGRTIREFIIGVLLVPSLFSCIWFAVFGGTALSLEINTNLALLEALKVDMSSTLFVMLESLPFGYIISIIATILILTFFVSSADSATFVLGMFSAKGSMEPTNKVKLVWGILQALVAVALLLSGGLQGLQTMSIVTALPFSIILVLMMLSFIMELRKEKIYKIPKHPKKH